MGFLFMLLHLFQIGSQIGHLVFQLPAMNHEHVQEFAQLHAGVAWAVVEVNDFLGLARNVRRSRVRSLALYTRLRPAGPLRSGCKRPMSS